MINRDLIRKNWYEHMPVVELVYHPLLHGRLSGQREEIIRS